MRMHSIRKPRWLGGSQFSGFFVPCRTKPRIERRRGQNGREGSPHMAVLAKYSKELGAAGVSTYMVT